MDGILTAINDFFRGVLWSIVSVFLFILDTVWSMVLRIATLDISKNSDLDGWFLLIMTWLVLFIIFRVAKISIKFLIDNEYREKISLSGIVIKIMLCGLIVGLTPLVYKGACSVSVNAIENVGTFIPLETEDMKMSSVLMQAGRVNIENPNSPLTAEVSRDENFDINSKDENDSYLYFMDYSSIFLMIIISIVAVFLFAMIALQIAQRFYLIMFKYLMAPYAIASFIDPEDNTFGYWVKMLGGDLIMNFAQIYGTYFLMFICNNSAIHKMLGDDWIALFARIMLFLGGLLALQELPAVIAGLTGGTGRGVMQSLQDLKSMTAASKGMTLGSISASAGTIGTSIAAAGSTARSVKAFSDTAKSAYANAVSSGAGATRAKASAVKAVVGGVVQPVLKKASNIYGGGLSERKSGSNQIFNQDATGSLDTPYTGDPPGVTHIPKVDSPPIQHNVSDLDAARYFGIDSPEKMSKSQLQDALKSKGHESTSIRSKEPGIISEQGNNLYQVNMKKAKGKK